MSLLERLLKLYDKHKVSSDLLPHPPAIIALLELNSEDENNIFKVYQCFVENLPKKGELAYPVYEELMKHVANFGGLALEDTVNLLNFLIKENLTTQNISNLVCEYCGYRNSNELTGILGYLKNSQILTQKNLDGIVNPHDSLFMLIVLYKISRTPDFGPLSQEMFDLLNRSPDDKLSMVNTLLESNLVNSQNLVRWLQFRFPQNNFLLTNDAFGIVWNRIPSHLLTQAVLDQLIRLSQQQNPEQPLREYVNQLIGVREDELALNREFVLNDRQSTHLY